MGNVYIPYMTLKFGNTSLSWRGSQNRPDYFTRLSHKRITEGANSAEITLTYAPKDGEDINFIEQAMWDSGGLCTFEYGALGRSSAKYEGLVHGYKLTINNGVLVYNLTLISRTARSRTSYVQSFTASSKRGSDNYYSAEQIGEKIKEYAETIPGYTYRVDNIDFKENLTFDTISVGEQKGPIDAIKSILGQLRIRTRWYSEDEEINNVYRFNDIDDYASGEVDRRYAEVSEKYKNTDHSSEYFLGFTVDDRAMEIRVFMAKKDSSTKSFTFNWGTKDSEVLSWSPQYDGTYALALASGEDNVSSLMKFSKTNGVEFATMQTRVPAVDESFASLDYFEAVENTSINKRVVDCNYPYKATLTVLGNTDTINIGSTTVTVNPVVAGKLHHTAGDYLVMGVTDEVSSSGFTTTYELVKCTSDSLYKTDSGDSQTYSTGVGVSEGAQVDADDGGSVVYPSDDTVPEADRVLDEVPDGHIGTYEWPLPGYTTINSPVGWRTVRGKVNYHRGVDVATGGKIGDPIVAAKFGKVITATYNKDYGYYVVIEHDETPGNQTLYAHMSELKVKAGPYSYVNPGTVIGLVGSTGDSTGPHLHYEVRVGGKRINPALLYPGKVTIKRD